MSVPVPMDFSWDGEVMKPLHPKLADKQFVVGEVYRFEVLEERSAASHRFYFVSIAEAHKNLSEELTLQHPTPEHLRKWALIKAGYRDERSVVCSSKAEALRMAAFIQPMDEYAVILCKGSAVTVYTAKSQSMKAQGKKDFEASKNAVLDIVAALIGVDRDTLTANAEKAA